MEKIKISIKLKELRKLKGVTQFEVAKAISVTESAYANYEQGIREPSYEILVKLCKYFEVSSDYLLWLTEI